MRAVRCLATVGAIVLIGGTFFPHTAPAQTTWVCQTGIEGVRIEESRAAGPFNLVYQFRDADDEVGSWGHIFDSDGVFYPKETGQGQVMLRAFAHAGYAVQTGDDLLVTYDGGLQKRVYLPAVTGFAQLYVAEDGSTYYDSNLVSLAQAAAAPSPTPTCSVMGYKTPSPTPSTSPSPVGYFTPTPRPQCYCEPDTNPWSVTLTDSSPTAGSTYRFRWSCTYNQENVYNWWTSSTGWLEIEPPRGIGFDGQAFSLSVSLEDTSGVTPGTVGHCIYITDELGWRDTPLWVGYAAIPWTCQTGIEDVLVQSPRGGGLYDLAYQFRDVDDIVGSWGHVFDSADIFYPKETGAGDVAIRTFAHAGYSTQTGDSLLVTYDGGLQKRVYLPRLTGYTKLYVAEDGSTFYDENLSSLAQAALAPSPSPTPSVMGQKTPSPTPSITPTPAGYLTPTPRPICYGAPIAEPGYITLRDSEPTAIVTYEFSWCCTGDPEYVYDWWTSATDWLVLSPSQGFGFDYQFFEVDVSLGDTSKLGPGETEYLCIFYDWLDWNTGCFQATYVGITPTPTPVPVWPGNPPPGDYNGDGTSDIAVFRPSQSLWRIRGLSDVYFAYSSDEPVPQDYDGDGAWDLAYWRSSEGLWKVKGQTVLYFGTSADSPIPNDYDGDTTCDFAFFRGTNGLWKVRAFTTFYFGTSADRPDVGDYDGDGSTDFAYFRNANGLWKVRNITTLYFGTSTDQPVPADYDGDGTCNPSYFRDTNGFWKVRGSTGFYFGGSTDEPVPGDYDGDGTIDFGYWRPSNRLWKINGITRVYLGLSDDEQVTNPYAE